MSEPRSFDPLVLGRRVRHYRRQAGLTLDQLGQAVGKPAPYLSLLENGKKEPRIQLVIDLASAMGVDVADLLEPNAPNRRSALEISLLKSQDTSLFESLGLPSVKPNARMGTETLVHLVGLHDAVRERSGLGSAGSDEVRKANGGVASLLAQRDGYLDHVEDLARDTLRNCGYPGEGPLSSRNLHDLAKYVGFDIHPIDDMPEFARSVIDLESNRIYIAQRNELRTRQARKAVLQTIAGFVLDHEPDPELATFLRQRMETAYFAGAVLAPEDAVVPRLTDAKRDHDIDVEDVKELFYLSYEMAAWRTSNLLTHHFGIRNHMIVSDEIGAVVKGFSNDGLPIDRDEHGGLETQRLCRRWGARTTLDSHDRFGTHHQFTDTPAGTFFCTTHVEAGREPAHAITLGVPFADARWFRGRDTENRETSRCPDPTCCRLPDENLSARWENKIIVSARSQARILGLLAPDPYPELDMPKILEVVEAHSS